MVDLQQPYPPGDMREDGYRFAEAIGSAVPAFRTLADEILADLRPGPPYGIWWWAGHVTDRRRIMIGDYLFACAQSVETNLVEATLHAMEARHAADEINRIRALRGGLAPITGLAPIPRAVSPAEHLPRELASLHQVGALRAIASALDCMGSAIVGVLGLSVGLKRADLGQTRGQLKTTVAAAASSAQSPGVQRQRDFGVFLEQEIAVVGPQGWLQWTLDYRHMVVHRGRRISLHHLEAEPAGGIVGSDGSPVVRLTETHLLARDPGRSDVETLRDFGRPPILQEEEDRTLSGVLVSARTLTEAVGARLVELWKERRSDPSLIVQPPSQWDEAPSMATTGFQGYSPGARSVSAQAILTHPIVSQRAAAAALDDAQRSAWGQFS